MFVADLDRKVALLQRIRDDVLAKVSRGSGRLRTTVSALTRRFTVPHRKRTSSKRTAPPQQSSVPTLRTTWPRYTPRRLRVSRRITRLRRQPHTQIERIVRPQAVSTPACTFQAYPAGVSYLLWIMYMRPRGRLRLRSSLPLWGPAWPAKTNSWGSASCAGARRRVPSPWSARPRIYVT